MTKLNVFFITLLCMLANNLNANQIIMVDPEDVHIATGFDENDDVQISVSLQLQNTCIRRPFGSITIVGNKIYIDMKATEINNPDAICIQTLIPQLVTVPIGKKLSHGTYEVKINPGRNITITDELIIEKSSSISIDNFTYANVTSIEKLADRSVLLLKGSHPSGCMSIDRIEVLANQRGNTYAVLPIIKKEQVICDRMMRPFSVEVPVPNLSEQTSVAFHVRTIAGHALDFRWK